MCAGRDPWRSFTTRSQRTVRRTRARLAHGEKAHVATVEGKDVSLYLFASQPPPPQRHVHLPHPEFLLPLREETPSVVSGVSFFSFVGSMGSHPGLRVGFDWNRPRIDPVSKPDSCSFGKGSGGAHVSCGFPRTMWRSYGGSHARLAAPEGARRPRGRCRGTQNDRMQDTEVIVRCVGRERVHEKDGAARTTTRNETMQKTRRAPPWTEGLTDGRHDENME